MSEKRIKERIFELFEALEAEPHIGMADSKNIWKAYCKLMRSVGGNPMNPWWKNRPERRMEVSPNLIWGNHPIPPGQKTPLDKS